MAATSEILNLLEQGVTLEAVANQFGVSDTTIHRWVNGKSVTRRRKPRISGARKHRIRKLINESDLAYREIARVCDVAPSTVLAIRDEDVEPNQFRKLRQPRFCPNHGYVRIWPCVACCAANHA